MQKLRSSTSAHRRVGEPRLLLYVERRGQAVLVAPAAVIVPKP